MTYREWLKRAKETRAAAVPDIRERLLLTVNEENKPPIRKVYIRRVVACVAAMAVVIVAVGCVDWLRRDKEQPNPTVSTPSVPIHTTLKAVTMLHSSTPTPVIDNMSMYVGARVLYATYNQPPEHSECQGVFYDMEQERYFCADHTMKSALEREGIPTAGLYMHYYHTAYGRIVFTCKDSARSSYVYDVSSDTFHRLPVSLNHCPGFLDSPQTTHPYVLLHKMGGTRDDLYLVNLLTAELTYILKDGNGNYLYLPMDDSQVTLDGKYVHYTLAKGGGEVVNSPARTTVLYEIATGKSRTFVGEIISYLADTERFFINTPDGYAVYDIATAEKTPYAESDLPAYYEYCTKHTDVYTEFDYRLLLCNRITGKEELVANEYVVASVINEQYLYYYIRGEEFLRVRDMIGGGEGYLPLDKNVVQETEGEENKNRSLRFGLQTDEERGEIWLYYSVTDIPRQSAEQIRQEREKWPYAHLEQLRESGEFTSIMALEPILRQFPNFAVTAYEGDGFLYLDYTALMIDGEVGEDFNPSGINIAFEDYESRNFYTIDHQRDSILSKFSYDLVDALPVDAQQETRSMLKELNIPIVPAPRDHRTHLSNDPNVKMQAQLKELSGERVRAHNFCYTISEMNGYCGARRFLEEEADLQELYAFIDFTDTLTFERMLDSFSEDAPSFYECHTYVLECLCWEIDSYEIYIGRMDGKPFLVKNGCLADLTEEQYSEWSNWMDKQEPKCHSN